MRAKAAVAAVLVLLAVACGRSRRQDAASLTGGDPERGASAIGHYGCGSCHTIPGIPGARGQVGPSLAGVRVRMYIAGTLGNDPLNVQHWIEDPHAINPRTVMPNLGVGSRDAIDITAYLYSLK